MIEVRHVGHAFVSTAPRETVTTRVFDGLTLNGTLEVVRREPYVTRSSKITPLHVVR